MPTEVKVFINGEEYSVEAESTILQAAASVGISIPTICFHDQCTANALCRICVVEVEGARTLIPACVAQVSEGLRVQTHSDRVIRVRRTILEMLSSSVDLGNAPDIQQLLQEYQARDAHFPEAIKRDPDVLDDNPMYIRDYAKCILCWRCVQVCAQDAQYTFAINFIRRGFETSIGTSYNHPLPETTCVFCGQCVGICPTGALKSRREWLFGKGVSLTEINKGSADTDRRQKINDQAISVRSDGKGS